MNEWAAIWVNLILILAVLFAFSAMLSWIGRRLLVALCASSARMLDRVRVRKVVPVLQDGMLDMLASGKRRHGRLR